MSEHWEIYTQPVEYIDAVRQEYFKALNRPELQVLEDLRDQETLKMDDGDKARVIVCFSDYSKISLPAHNLTRYTPIDINIAVIDETNLKPEDIRRGWGNRLPDLRGVIFLGGRFFAADSRYFRGIGISCDELPLRDQVRYRKGDLSRLDLTGLQFIPSQISFSLVWGDRIDRFKQKRIKTSLLCRIETRKVLGLFETGKRVMPQTKEEWEIAIREEYKQIKSDNF